MIPGLAYGRGIVPSAGGGASALSFSLVGYSTSTSTTISMPSGTVIGDWAILFDACVLNESGVPSATPSGWASIANTELSGAYSYRMSVSHKVLTSTSTITGMSSPGSAVSDEKAVKILFVFRPTTSIVTTTASTWNAELTTGNPSAQTVTASGVQAPLIVFGFAAYEGSSAPAFTTATPAMTYVTKSAAALSIRVGYTVYNTSPANQSLDIADTGTQGLQSGYVRFT